MLDSLNNRILHFLEKHNWKMADIYWHYIGKYVRY